MSHLTLHCCCAILLKSYIVCGSYETVYKGLLFSRTQCIYITLILLSVLNEAKCFTVENGVMNNGDSLRVTERHGALLMSSQVDTAAESPDSKSLLYCKTNISQVIQ